MKQQSDSTSKEPTRAKKILRKVSTVFFILLFTAILACVVSIITTKYIYHKPAALFGYRIVKILTDSMTPQLPTNSYILVKNIDGADVKEGDIVVHIPAYGTYEGYTMTHMCVKGPYFDETYQKTCILTQGTKAGAPVDPPVPIANVQSVFVSSIARAGGFFDFLTSIWGIMVMVAVPSLIVIVLQVIRMVKAVVDKPDEEAVHAEAERIAEERRDADSSQANAADTDVGTMGDVLAFIAREKAKSAGTSLDANVISRQAVYCPERSDGARDPLGSGTDTEAVSPQGSVAPEGHSSTSRPLDEMDSVLAFIAREKAKSAGTSPDDPSEPPPSDD